MVERQGRQIGEPVVVLQFATIHIACVISLAQSALDQFPTPPDPAQK